jgi:ORF6N domain-containing protein
MSKAVIPIERIASAILMLRDQRVMLDYDLAALYGVETRALKQAVRRNPDRFPNDFMFELSEQEIDTVVSQFVIPDRRRFGGAKPMAFTEQGIAMLSSVLNSERAIKVNIAIMRAFVKLREMLETNRELARKFSELEQRVGKHDEEITAILEAIRQLIAPPKKARREIGFHVREKAPRYRVRKRA